MTESEVFESVTGSGSSDFAILVEILNRHRPWCLIGGLAVNCYVEPVYTLDADIVVISSELPAVSEELLPAGFSVQEFPPSLNARMTASALRIQFSLDDRYQGFPARSRVFEMFGQNVRVAILDDVIQGKIWAWTDVKRRPTKRKKDELDLMRILEKYPETRPAMPEEIQSQVPE
jgi:hypothetical protein